MDQRELERLLEGAVREIAPPDEVARRVRNLMPSAISAAASSWIAAARAVLAEIRLDTRAQPALAGFRGQSAIFQVLAAAGEHEVFLQAGGRAAGAQARVRGQLGTTSGGDLACEIAAVPVSGVAGPTVVRAGTDGMFELVLPPGRYDLAVGLDPPFLVPGLELV